MPMLDDFRERLRGILPEIIRVFKTPFILYDEKGIRQGFKKVFENLEGAVPFREYFAVKATPNPEILKIMKSMRCGFDCSSISELVMVRCIGAKPEDIMFTSNNTSLEEFEVALSDGGCILNLDDISMIPKVPKMPELICFRYNPGKRRSGNNIIGNPEEAKYGVPHENIVDAYAWAKRCGAKRFGIHTMICSNELNYGYMVETVRMLERVALMLYKELGITLEFINMGGGIGIPHKPTDKPVDIEKMCGEIVSIFRRTEEKYAYAPQLYMELGRYMTGPHGVLVMTAINRMSKYREYVGVDACMNANMRPAIYGAYHHISVFGKDGNKKTEVVDVVGSLCENNDKFAVQRTLPVIKEGDILIQEDVGAHGPAMGFNYNGRLKPKELLWRWGGAVECIRREQTNDDYFATLSGDGVGASFQPWKL